MASNTALAYAAQVKGLLASSDGEPETLDPRP